MTSDEKNMYGAISLHGISREAKSLQNFFQNATVGHDNEKELVANNSYILDGDSCSRSNCAIDLEHGSNLEQWLSYKFRCTIAI